jgi:bacteriorhodopsin
VTYWLIFGLGCAALAYIVYMLTFEARRHANGLGSDVGRVFLMCGALTTILWILYPVAWGVCEGGNVISPDSEAAFYGVLDVLAKPVFGALLIFGHRNIAPARLGLRIPDYEGDPSHHGGATDHGEKPGRPSDGTNTTAGVTGNGTGATVGAGHNTATV